ncbi:MAG: hypothetical protein DCC88_02355 [Spirobacillus cienkowskii]|jgi:ribosomal protein RSM22 (predicted rRNA methylase)|uniref:Methyltransferase domain-containing protein n=1 Tax=Spirobacillus cienkowskii TaxID=495820 RepID=A0A369KTA7_9BACT|nr:MAG: hypothetical protein DCC88_02355 [Spirobacillus cienkowskii]
MRNFYEVESKYFFNVQKYIENWENFIGLSNLDTTQEKKLSQSIASHVLKLWTSFNKDRKNLDKHYMDSSVNIKSYLASFLLPNIERVFSILVRKENTYSIEKLLNDNVEELVIADFGCGPLSGTVGILASLEYIYSKNPHLNKPKKIFIYAIDRAKKVMQQGATLIEKSKIENAEIFIEHISSTEKILKQIHIVTCINVFNELPEKFRLKNLQNLFDHTVENGLILILEPGQVEHAKSLSNLRDEFLEIVNDCSIVSPCPHNKKCPLSGKTSRQDWCWFKHSWNPPKTICLIDKYTKLDHYELNYSYLIFQKGIYKKLDLYFARAVSDEFRIRVDSNKNLATYIKNNLVSGNFEEFNDILHNKNGINKVLLCTKEGDLESAYVVADESQKEYHRGNRINDNLELYIRTKERN